MSDNHKKSINHYSVKPLHVVLRASRLLAGVMILAFLAFAALVVLLPLPVWGKALLLIVLSAEIVRVLLQHVLMRMPQSVTMLEVSLHGQLRCHTPRQGWVDAQLQGSSFVTPWLTVLNVRLTGQRFARSVVLLPDALDANQFRELRVWLRWGGETVLADG